MSRIIGKYWFHSLEGSFGIVKTISRGLTNHYIGPCKGDDEEKDAEYILKKGAPINTCELMVFLSEPKTASTASEIKIEIIEEPKTIRNIKIEDVYAAACFGIAIGIIVSCIVLK